MTKALLLDLSGVLYDGDAIIPGALDAARQWLLQRGLRPYCLVHDNIREDFADFEQGDPDAVLVADAAQGFNYDNLNRAFQLCLEGAPLLGVGYNCYFKSAGEVLMDAGIPACLVRTGKYRPGDEEKIEGDFAVVDSIVEAVALLG